jgi:CII-binding regulator of phage lambda lysogenization HflD
MDSKPKGPIRKLKKAETKALIPLLKKFNQMAKVLITSLANKVKREEEELAHIKIMVSGMKIPKQAAHLNTINIQTIDINTTKITTKGQMSYNQVMDWEKRIRTKNKGIIL